MFLCSYALMPCILGLESVDWLLSSFVCPLFSVFCPLSSVLDTCRERTTNQTFFAKRTQIPKKSNERKYFYNNELRTTNYEL